jgi:hypothetical protein
MAGRVKRVLLEELKNQIDGGTADSNAVGGKVGLMTGLMGAHGVGPWPWRLKM